MNNQLKGRLALITGGSKGLGRAITLTLASQGSDVIVFARNKEFLKRIRKEIEKYRVNSYVCIGDATDQKNVAQVFSTVVKKIGRLDILVNNTGGVEKFGNFFELTADDWKKSYELNLLTAVYFTKEAIPWLKKSLFPRIINISTVAARQPGYFNPHYSAAKTALINLSKHLANILAEDKILVNTVCPSTLDGGAWERNVSDKANRQHISFEDAQKAMRADEERKVPLKRVGNLNDIASLVAFLASDAASFITGGCINIDGGTVRSIF